MKRSEPATIGNERALRRLFLTLFLRGRAARGLRKDTAPKSIGSKLALTLVMYALVGAMALLFLRQPVFALSVYLHGMTLVFLGMFVAGSAGEVLFNKEEADILLHRPITPRALLRAKVSVLVRVSLWLAGAFNLVGFIIGGTASNGGWLFLPAHAISTTLQALFCTGGVVMGYQLCLRWFGRDRLDALMTTVQVIISVAAVSAGQIVPRLVGPYMGKMHLSLDSWWIGLLPPAWFAGFDDAIAGRGGAGSWALAGVGTAATALVLWLAFGKLARDYASGLQSLNEAAPARPRQRDGRRRWIDRLVSVPPLRWWLRDSVTRASFLLTAAYLVRDRDVKLRIYPGLAPMMMMPLVFLFRDFGRGAPSVAAGAFSGFGIAFAGSYLGLVPLMALDLLRFSAQWHAADLFRAAPMPGPAPLCHGARRAVLFFLVLPALVAFGLLAWVIRGGGVSFALLLPGLIALPVYALVPCLGGAAVPFSLPTEEAKSAGRGLRLIAVMIVSLALSGTAVFARATGWFGWLLVAESLIAALIYAAMLRSINAARWLAVN